MTLHSLFSYVKGWQNFQNSALQDENGYSLELPWGSSGWASMLSLPRA